MNNLTFDKLSEFIGKKMRMSHIYQPLLIRSLLDCGGAATLRQLAGCFLDQDESQILFYEDRIKKMPVPVLKSHGILDIEGQLVRLKVGKLTFKERTQLKAACDQKIQEFLEKRGLATWDYRLLELDPVPDTIRYEVLRRAGGKCELCGCSSKERPLHVDHIIPRSKRGSNDIENLQALCEQCNLAKSNRDATDFRQSGIAKHHDGCVFCSEQVRKRMIESTSTMFVVEDQYPVTKHHCLIIPFRHTEDLFSMTDVERRDSDDLARYLRNRLQKDDPTVIGFNAGYNCGEVAGQTVMHAHMHLIPRRKGDVQNPEGGVRGVVPERMRYRK
jgi:diadenosine tetraphosphate (Ap4A) HIT family hydrolase